MAPDAATKKIETWEGARPEVEMPGARAILRDLGALKLTPPGEWAPRSDFPPSETLILSVLVYVLPRLTQL
jgi:hypothetical protein